MPELPEVEIVKRALEPALVGRDVERMVFNRPNLRVPLPDDLPALLKGRRFARLIRRGKYILAFTDAGVGFVLHLGMSGVVRVEEVDVEAQTLKHDHVELYMKDGPRVVLNDPRRFGFLIKAQEEGWAQDAPFNKMGPEPLSNDFSGPVLAEALKGKRGPIKVALLDQAVVAGVGNIYACEALFKAGIDPARPAGEVQGVCADALAQAIRDVLNRAIEAGGSSLKDYRHTDGDLGYFQHEFAVYDRFGHACPGCECDIVKSKGIAQIRQAGRSTFYCPQKQR